MESYLRPMHNQSSMVFGSEVQFVCNYPGVSQDFVLLVMFYTIVYYAYHVGDPKYLQSSASYISSVL